MIFTGSCKAQGLAEMVKDYCNSKMDFRKELILETTGIQYFLTTSYTGLQAK